MKKNGSMDIYNIYLKEIDKYFSLNAEEEYEYLKQIKEGNNEALDEFFKHYLGLVIMVVKSNYYYDQSIFMDLVQEGNIGLYKAIFKFDKTKSKRFSTYATIRIKSEISRYIENSKENIRIPVYKQEEISKFDKKVKKLNQDFKRELDAKEISEILNRDIKEVQQLMSENIMNISLNTEINSDEGSAELLDFIPSNKFTDEDAISKVAESNLLKCFFEICDKIGLSPLEIKVLDSIIGLRSYPISFQELSDNLGIKYSKTYSIYRRAIYKLRKNHKYLKSIASYSDNPKESIENAKKLYYEEYIKTKKQNLILR